MALRLVDTSEEFEYICEEDRDSDRPTRFYLTRETAKEVNSWHAQVSKTVKSKRRSKGNDNMEIDPDKFDQVEVSHFCAVVNRIEDMYDPEEKKFYDITEEDKIRAFAHLLPIAWRVEITEAASEASVVSGIDEKK